MEMIVGIAGTVVALVSAIFAYLQAQAAKHSLSQASTTRFFSAFESASQLCVNNPELLRSVHGLNVDAQEAKNIAYLGLLLDAFQHYYGEKYEWNFDKMEPERTKQSSFLNKLLSVPQNQERWTKLKEIYYGNFDAGFVREIEALITYENARPTN
jgi:hypothetical protein